MRCISYSLDKPDRAKFCIECAVPIQQRSLFPLSGQLSTRNRMRHQICKRPRGIVNFLGGLRGGCLI
jgi:hypothetical protein